MQNTILLEGVVSNILKLKKGSSFLIKQKQYTGIIESKVIFGGDYIPKENEPVVVTGKLLSTQTELVIYANHVAPSNANVDDLLSGKFESKH